MPQSKTETEAEYSRADYAGERPEAVRLADVRVKFDERGLVPCVVQQAGTGEVLMVAWMNEESLALTIKTGTTWFWSRSRFFREFTAG